MNNENKAVNQLTELLTTELELDTFQAYKLKIHLNCLYSIGFYDGSVQNSHRRKVEQLKDGKVTNTYNSVSHAARVNGVNKATISRAIQKNTVSKKGSMFRFKVE